jgi:hypothetical protein
MTLDVNNTDIEFEATLKLEMNFTNRNNIKDIDYSLDSAIFQIKSIIKGKLLVPDAYRGLNVVTL